MHEACNYGHRLQDTDTDTCIILGVGMYPLNICMRALWEGVNGSRQWQLTTTDNGLFDLGSKTDHLFCFGSLYFLLFVLDLGTFSSICRDSGQNNVLNRTWPKGRVGKVTAPRGTSPPRRNITHTQCTYFIYRPRQTEHP